jgi:hypothetical protein
MVLKYFLPSFAARSDIFTPYAARELYFCQNEVLG